MSIAIVDHRCMKSQVPYGIERHLESTKLAQIVTNQLQVTGASCMCVHVSQEQCNVYLPSRDICGRLAGLPQVNYGLLLNKIEVSACSLGVKDCRCVKIALGLVDTVERAARISPPLFKIITESFLLSTSLNFSTLEKR